MADSLDAQVLVEKLYKAFNDPGFLGLGGTDEEAVLAALKSAQEKGLMQEVDKLYSEKYHDELDEPNLKDELDDELSGEDFDKAMKFYNDGMAGKGKKTAALPSSASTGVPAPKRPGGPVHGTVAPKSPFEKWREDVVSALDEIRKKVDSGGGPWFGLVDDRYVRRDVQNWSVFESGSKLGPAFMPVVADYDAIVALQTNMGAWTLDCATFAEVALFQIWRKYLGNRAKWESRFKGKGITLKNHDSTPIPRQLTVVSPDREEPEGLPAFNAGFEASPPGSKISWENSSPAAHGTAFNFEYGIKRTHGGSAVEHRYDAFPLGFDRGEDFIIRELAGNSGDFPASFMLTADGLKKVEEEEATFRPLHAEMAKRVGADPFERLPPEAVRILKSDAIGKTYPTPDDFEDALQAAGVDYALVQSFKKVSALKVDPAAADAYIRKYIRRHDYTRPKLP